MHLLEHIASQAVHHQTLAQAGSGVTQCYREGGSYRPAAGDSALPPIVLLHGIGSGAASWTYQLDAANWCDKEQCLRVLAWDAPGYGNNTPLAQALPSPQDYAQQLWQWLDALHLQHVQLVGHSLGCIMAASAATLQPQRVASMVLLAPAQGYARAP